MNGLTLTTVLYGTLFAKTARQVLGLRRQEKVFGYQMKGKY